MGNRRSNMATKPCTTSLSTDCSCETLWQVIIRGNLVLYFKSNGKAKNKLRLAGGFEFYLNIIDLVEN